MSVVRTNVIESLSAERFTFNLTRSILSTRSIHSCPHFQVLGGKQMRSSSSTQLLLYAVQTPTGFSRKSPQGFHLVLAEGHFAIPVRAKIRATCTALGTDLNLTHITIRRVMPKKNKRKHAVVVNRMSSDGKECLIFRNQNSSSGSSVTIESLTPYLLRPSARKCKIGYSGYGAKNKKGFLCLNF
ncbi:hypothetical protein P879_10546 [Paragonimus westermani]|uniref:Uncharacterized protein n=1 Tax=Paragonimus westermani TaxID=34504 RepID=A0A8T0D6D9_9TREM|nr:hypothetical protein P879_10546 [Paragonimus westermani]